MKHAAARIFPLMFVMLFAATASFAAVKPNRTGKNTSSSALKITTPAVGAACETKAASCSKDATTLFTCEDKRWAATSCAATNMLCEKNTCVFPWRYGNPKWSRGENEPKATSEKLSEKAFLFDDVAVRLHLREKIGFILAVQLPCGDCVKDEKHTCAGCVVPNVTEHHADSKYVERWLSGENDGLWSALYLASQAFRYAATKDPSALKTIRILMDGVVIRMRVTGVPGVFTRQYIPPGIRGLVCPDDPESYVPDVEKDDNKWVRIGGDGCIRTFDPATRRYVASNRCGLEQYAGYCWLDNVSKDEYSGHMFALGAVAKLVDDPEIRATANELLLQVGRHLVSTELQVTDWDGRITEHGRLQAFTMEDYPGFNAAMALSFMKTAAASTKDPGLNAWYEQCLLKKPGTVKCPQPLRVVNKPYTDFLNMAGMYVGKGGEKSNYNNISMHMLSLHNLIWFETDEDARKAVQKSLDVDVFRAKNQPRAIQFQNNALFDFIFAAHKRLGPGSDGPAYEAVENGVRMLRRFPTVKHAVDQTCPPGRCVQSGTNRFGGPEGKFALTPDERCPDRFMWWGDPYGLENCKYNGRIIEMPQDYLLAYWMGRYYGFITPDM